MNFKPLLEKIESSLVFQKFKEQYPDAELCAGFFILDFLSNDNKNSLDYKINNKIFTFSIKKDDITMQEDELIKDSKHPPLQKIDDVIKVEVDELKSIVGVQALDNGINSKLSKIIAVLQKFKKEGEDNPRQIWNLTCMLEGLIILNILIDANLGEVIKFERKSIMDLVKKK